MLSATDFLPARMITFMSFETTRFPYFGSGLISRFSALWRRDIVLSVFHHDRACPGHLLALSFPGLASLNRGDLRKEAELLRPLCSVFGAPLLPILHALSIEHTAQNVVAHPRQVLDAAAADHHHRVLLQIMALARDVADHLEAVGEPHLCDLAQRRVRLLRRGRVDARADSALLRRLLQRRHGVTLGLLRAR